MIPWTAVKFGAVGIYVMYLLQNCEPIERTKQIGGDFIPGSPTDLVPFMQTEQQSLDQKYGMLTEADTLTSKYSALESKLVDDGA